MSIIFNDLKKHIEAQDAVMDLIGNHPTHVFYGSVPTHVVNKKGQKVAVGQNAGSYDKMNPYIVIEGDGGVQSGLLYGAALPEAFFNKTTCDWCFCWWPWTLCRGPPAAGARPLFCA